MATQQRKRNTKQGDRNAKAKRKRNTKRGEATQRQGYPLRNVPPSCLTDDQRDVVDAVNKRNDALSTRPSTVRQRDQRNVNARGE